MSPTRRPGRAVIKTVGAAGVLAVGVAVLCVALGGFGGHTRPGEPCDIVDSLPRIRPDYAGVVIPPNMAPLNFLIEEPGTDHFVRLHAAHGAPIEVFGKTGKIVIPEGPWQRLVAANRGDTLNVDVFVRPPVQEGTGGKRPPWKRFKTIVNTIAAEEIDGYLVYRRIRPGHEVWRRMGVYQRDLSGFDEKVILDNGQLRGGCLNCHTFCNHHTDKMLLGIRSATYGSSALLIEDERVRRIGTKFGYTSWHPSGQVAAFSVNQVHQVFHSAASEIRDVFDSDSLIAYYRLDTEAVETAAPLSNKDRLETYPTWSPDGRYLYFSSAPVTWEDTRTLPNRLDQIRYDLVRAPYDVDSDTWGPLETVLSAQETGKSLMLPRISPDGRWLLFVTCDYGCFPVYRPSSDLCLMDLQAFQQTGRREYRRLDANSDASESWHSFSSNGRWIAFSSKRLSHIFTRTYLAYFDEQGRVHKPILLPQKDPLHYDSCLWTFSVPELVSEPIRVSRRALAQALRDTAAGSARMPVTMATPKADAGAMYAQPVRE